MINLQTKRSRFDCRKIHFHREKKPVSIEMISFRIQNTNKLTQNFMPHGMNKILHLNRAPVAWLSEHRTVMREVASSNPGQINT